MFREFISRFRASLLGAGRRRLPGKLQRAYLRRDWTTPMRVEPLEQRQLLSVTVLGRAWQDNNSNGLQTAGEANAQYAVAELFNSVNGVIGDSDDISLGQQVTDAAGSYHRFTGLAAGNPYYMVVRPPAGFSFTTQDVGSDDALDSDVSNVGRSAVFTPTNGATVRVDAGLTGATPAFGWAATQGSTLKDFGYDVTVDSSGFVYQTGVNTVPPGTNSEEIVVSKYTSAGALVWQKVLGGTLADEGQSIAVDNSGNVYVSGIFQNTVDFDPGTGVANRTSAGSYDAFLLKLDSNGALVWVDAAGGAGVDEALGLSLDNQGNVLVSGLFQFTVDFDPGASVANNTATGPNTVDMFVWKLAAADGSFQWVKTFGNSGEDVAYDVSTDSSGNVLVVGSFEGSVDFDPGADTTLLNSLGSSDIFLLKLTSAGSLVWARQIGGSQFDRAYGIRVDASGNVYSSGYTNGTADLDPGVATLLYTTAGQEDPFVVKVDSSGNFLWGRGLGGTGRDLINAIALDASGNVYAAGYFETTMDFDPGPGTFSLVPNGPYDAFLWKLTTNGDFSNAIRWGGSGAGSGIGLAADASNVYVTGYLDDTVDFDPGTGISNFTSAGDWDAYLLELLPTSSIGNRVWNDFNGNGIQDGGEPGVAGAAVELLNPVDGIAGNGNDVSLGTQTTDASGNYSFTNVYAGTYYVRFQKPSGYTFTARDAGGDDALDSDANYNGYTAIFSLAAGTTDTSRDAGLRVAADRIVFSSNRDGDYDLYQMDPAGGNVLQLTNAIGTDNIGSWSPSGDKLLFSSNRGGNYDIYVQNADGTGLIQLTNNAADDSSPAWSPDGSQIAFYSLRDGNWETYVMNADGSGQQRLTNDAGVDFFTGWSPDGSRLLLHSNRTGNSEIFVINADGSGSPVNLTNNAAEDAGARWSPDGTKILFTSWRDGDGEIWVMNADGSSPTQLTFNSVADNGADWSPNGSQITFWRDNGPNREIYVMNANGSGQTNITGDASIDDNPRWSQLAIDVVNDAPTLDAISNPPSINEDAGQQTINLAGITAGPGESQTLTVTASSDNPGLIPNPSVAYTSPNSTGSLSYTPVANQNGTAHITVTVTDNGGTANGGVNSVTRTFTMVVSAVNDPPVRTAGNPAAISVAEDSANLTVVTLGLGSLSYSPGGGSDEAGQALTYKVTAIPAFIKVFLTDGTTEVTANTTLANLTALQGLQYKTVANASGTGNVSWTVQDNGGGTDTLTENLSITVNAVNDTPTLDLQTFTIDENAANGSAVGTVVATDPDGPSLTYSIVSAYPMDGAFAINPATAAITVANSSLLDFETLPQFGGYAYFLLTVRVQDNGSPNQVAANTITVNLRNVNEAPSIGSVNLTPASAYETSTLSATPGGATDPEGSAVTFSYQWLVNGSVVSGQSSSTLTGTYFNAGDTVKAHVTPGDGSLSGAAVDSNTLTIKNSTPSLGLQTFTINENAANGSAVGTVAASDPDPAQSLTFSIVSAYPADGAFAINPATGAIIVANSSLLNFEALPQFGGYAYFLLTVLVDDNGSPSEGFANTITVQLRDVNEAPMLSAITSPAAINEDAGQQTISLSGITAGSGENQMLTVTATSDNPGLILNPSVIYSSPSSTGSLSYTPVANQNGSATITVTVMDNGGTANGGVNSVTRTFTVTVNAVNDAPSFTKGADQTIGQGAPLQTVPGWATNISAGPSDEAGQTLTFTATVGPVWGEYAGGAQHTAISPVPSQPLETIHWQTPVDLNPQYSGDDLLIHYGSPLVTAANTVILPVKTGTSDGFKIEGRSGTDGSLRWTQTTDYILPPHNWTPSYAPTLTPLNRLYYAGAGGTVYYRDNLDTNGTVTATQLAFYGLGNYMASAATYNSTVYISTPITSDAAGNIYFGFTVTGANPLGLTSGIARITPSGTATYVSATAASGDAGLTQVVQNAAPALSNDGNTLYVVVSSGNFGRGDLVALNSTTLATVASTPLKDPKTGSDALIAHDGTASPMVGPDGDVYFGVLENPFLSNHDRGWLLHFSGNLAQTKTPGAFGWDDTPSVVPASMVPSYIGSSSYLLMTKYNNYASVGGDGVNKLAILDPHAAMTDPISGASVMQEVLAIAGVTPDDDFPGTNAVREWCINTAVVDPSTGSVLANSEDGKLYRWDLATNTFTQSVTLTSGIGEAYTPTLIGADGTVYAINNATLFAVGAMNPVPFSGFFSVAPSVSPTTGNLTYQTAPSASGTVTVSLMLSDSGSGTAPNVNTSAIQTFTITVVSVNHAPTIGPQTFIIDENLANGSAVGTVLANDPDAGQSLTYSITGGNAGGAFAIDPGTGAITVANSSQLDFEALPHSGGFGYFSLTVQVEDSGSPALSATNTITINIRNVNEAPSITSVSLTPLSAFETSTLTATVNGSSDPDGDTVSFTYQWFVNGSPVAGSTNALSGVSFNKNDSVQVRVTPSDGTASGTAVFSNSITIQNSLPSISSISLAPLSAFESSTLTATVNGAADADGDAISFTYQWFVNGSPVAGSINTLSGASFNKNDSVQVRVTPSDGAASGTAVFSNSVTIQNSLPSIMSVSLTPLSASESSTLTATVGTTSDADGDAINVSYQWIVNGSIVPGQTGSALSGAYFSKGNTVKVRVTPSDGTASGTPVDSNTVTINNSAPSITSISLAPTTAFETSTLIATVNGAADADGDAISFIYQWLVNGSPVAGSTNTLSGASFNQNDSVQVRVTPSDGTASGTAVFSNSVTIQNSLPTIASVSLTPTTAFETSTLTATVNGPADADGDTISFSYQWLVNGSPVGSSTSTLSGNLFNKNDSVKVRVTPNDGMINGAAVDSNAITIQNSLPSITSVSLTPLSPTESSTLSASVGTTSDADGDTVTVSYQWFVNGVVVSGQTGSTLSNAYFGKGNSIKVRVTPNDGTANGAAVDSNTVTVGNTAPSIISVTLAPSPAFENSTLTATPNGFFDADGDAASYSYQWFVNSTLVSGQSGNTFTGAYFTKGNTVQVRITPSDGSASGAAVDSNIVSIQNSAPVANSQTVTTNEDNGVAITLTGSDADSDGLTFTLVGSPVHGTLGGTIPNFNYTPAIDYNGPDSLTFKVNDGSTDSTTVTVNIAVTAVNDAPSFALIGNPPATYQTSGLQTVPGLATNIKPGPATATDEASQTVTFNVQVIGTTGTLAFSSAPAIDSTGKLTYIAAPGTIGSALLSVRAVDSGSGLAPNVNTSPAQTFTITVNLAATRFFDFNNAASPTEDGYIGVPYTLYSAGYGYGWSGAAVSGFDRTAPNKTLQDGNYNLYQNNQPSTFSADVPNGTYYVNVVLGDNQDPMDGVQISAEGTIEYNNLTTAIGQFIQRAFTIVVTDQKLDVEIKDTGGSQLKWAINELSLRPFDNIGSLAMTGPGSGTPDGITVDTITGLAPTLADNSLVTVQTNMGTIVTDASPILDGTQAKVVGGQFTFQVRRPSSAGTPTLIAQAVDGSADVTVTNPAVLGYALPTTRKFDFNSPTSPNTTSGYLSVLSSTMYAPSSYGWRPTVSTPAPGILAPTLSFDRPAMPASTPGADLLRDAVYSTSATPSVFSVDVPSGTYFVSMSMGDYDTGTSSYMDQVQVAAEGTTQLNALATSPGQIIHRSFTVAVNDGTLDIQIRDTGGANRWYLNSLELRAGQNALSITGGPGASAAADGSTIDAFSGSGATANSIVTITASLGTVTSDQHAVYAGAQAIADSSGNFTFTLKRPGSGGTATIAAEESTGASFGTTTQSYTTVSVRRFDFNSTTSPVTNSGYTAVSAADTFNATNGYGWNDAVVVPTSLISGYKSVSNIAGVSGLKIDSHMAPGTTAHTFTVSGSVGSQYYVRVYSGAVDTTRKTHYQVTGDVVKNANTTNTVDVQTSLTSAVGVSGTFSIVVYSDAGSYWAINGIDVWDASMGIGGTSPSLPLLASTPAANSDAASSITNADVQPIVAEAITRWAATGLSAAQLVVLKSTQLQIVNLGDSLELGNAMPGGIQIDDNAAGWGWYVDPTPSDDGEFSGARSSPATGKMDLLTLVMHELGHELGLDHAASANSLMSESLPAGTRRAPEAASSSAGSSHSAALARHRDLLFAAWQ